MARVNYSSRVIERTKTTLKKEITLSLESTPELRKEIAKVFQQANRRIQNVEKSGYLSPAVESLNLDPNLGFAKFNFSGKSWAELKIEYAKAVSFLQKPSSTASGAKQYENHIREVYNLNKFEFDAIKHQLQNKLLTPAENAFVSGVGMRYSDYSGEFETYKNSLADQIETDAKRMKDTENFNNALDKDLKALFPELAKEIGETETERILKGFKDFGM